MQMSAPVLCGLVFTLATTTGSAQQSLPRSDPESQGVSSPALLELTNCLDERFDGIHSLMIVRNGKIITEGWWAPYDAQQNHVLYSLSKSFTSTAVGLAVAEGKLDIDDRVLDYFPEDAPQHASENLKAMRVRDILTMTTGHQDAPPVKADQISAKSFFAQPVPHVPGTHFKYNTAATFMQSALVQKLTSQTVLEYLEQRLFEPLGIERPVWETNTQGISLGGYGLRVRTEDIAKLGQLYLQKGRWHGQQLLPQEWVELATTKQVPNGNNPISDWNQGYGFQFWRCRHNAYRGDGAFSQFCIVIPAQQAVVAITSGERDMQAVMNVVWDKLLPALAAKGLPADPQGWGQLRTRLAELSVKQPSGVRTSPLAGRLLNRRWEFAANDLEFASVEFVSADTDKHLILKLNWDGRLLEIPAGFGEWKQGRAAYPASWPLRFPDESVAGTFAWVAEDTLVVKFCASETPGHMTFTMKVAADLVTCTAESNVAFAATRLKVLPGD